MIGDALVFDGVAHPFNFEADNARAVRLYADDGFTHDDRDTHVMYRRG